jgi:hypothetical protein
MPKDTQTQRLAAKSTPMKLAVVLALICLLPSCQSTLECGAWTFIGTPNADASPNDSFPLSSSFVFNPASCGKSCQCTTDAMIQMVWVYDAADQTYLVGYGESLAWADSNGWMIDQQPLIGWAEGWYGLNNDGTTFDSGYNAVGSNGTPNTLNDSPGGQPANTYFYAVDVAACFKSDGCQNRILGYYFWSWIIDDSGVGQKFITAPAWQDLNIEFQSAVAAWNAWAPTSGPVGGGSTGQILVPHAIPFPTLTDL